MFSIVSLVVGFVLSYFVFKNNPKVKAKVDEVTDVMNYPPAKASGFPRCFNIRVSIG